VKWRNQLLALFCLFAFAGFGVFYFQHWVVQKPFGIVLFVGEGLTPSRLAATRLYAGGGDAKLSIDSMPHVALLRNHSVDFGIPDQAAAATALATGTKVNNQLLSVDSTGKSLRTIVELARANGRATGLVTNGRLTDPTAAAFFAHSSDPRDTEKIAQQFAERRPFDVAFGGGAADFLPTEKNGARADGRDLLLELRRDGYDVVRSNAELEALPAWRRPKVYGFFSDADLPFAGELAAEVEHPALPEMVRRAIELLQFNTGGYLLVVDAALPRVAARQNHVERTLTSVLELDRAVAVARRYVGRKATIVVAGDCGIGGLTLNGFPFKKDSGIALLGLNSSGDPWFTWATGPNGPKNYGASILNPTSTPHGADGARTEEPAAVFSEAALNTAEDTIAAGVGLGTDRLQGIREDTAVFALIRDCL
jgi:alkaline phosphatase